MEKKNKSIRMLDREKERREEDMGELYVIYDCEM
jgi:hypothetical protein